MTHYITKHIQVISGAFLKVFRLTLFPERSPSPDFPGLLLFFVEIRSDIFIFCDFFTYGQFLLKITKNERFQNIPNMTLS